MEGKGGVTANQPVQPPLRGRPPCKEGDVVGEGGGGMGVSGRTRGRARIAPARVEVENRGSAAFDRTAPPAVVATGTQAHLLTPKRANPPRHPSQPRQICWLNWSCHRPRRTQTPTRRCRHQSPRPCAPRHDLQ